jgi:hypothetical protein
MAAAAEEDGGVVLLEPLGGLEQQRGEEGDVVTGSKVGGGWGWGWMVGWVVCWMWWMVG